MPIPLTNGRATPEVTFTLIRIALDLNSPTDSDFAAWLWQVLSDPCTDPAWAMDVYMRAGYIPFTAYPLQRDPAFKRPLAS